METHIPLATLPPDWQDTLVLSLEGLEQRSAPDPGATDHPRIGKYEVAGLLGKGAMGAVYRGFDPALEREVALKVMLPRIADDPDHKRRFEREARAAARLCHPNVVTVFDLGYHTDGSPYIVMELLEGRDLAQELRAGAPSFERKIEIVLQVLEGLGHAHRAGVVHRDVKPANVFIGHGGAVKIMDFGVAHLPAASVTGGVVVGTANYMSPEQVLGQAVDGRSDLFSVGAMLAELVTGQPPFEGETAMATLYRVAHQPPRLELPPGSASGPLRSVLERLLDKSPDKRFASCGEAAGALRRVLGGRVAPQAAPAAAHAPRRPADPTGICRMLQEVHLGRKSGHLHFSEAGRRRSLRVADGRILHATSDVAGEHLGDVLVRFGRLGQADLERAIAVVLGERKRLGRVLQEMGLIEREALEAAVGEHVREILFAAMERPDAGFGFEELPESEVEADLRSALTTAEAILEATRRVQDPQLIQGALGDLDRVLVPARDPRLEEHKVALTPTDAFVLSRVDGTLTARELISLIPGPREDAERSLFGLLSIGLVDAKTRAGAAAPSAARRERVAAPPQAPRPAPAAPAPLTPPVEGARETPAGEALRELILGAYDSLRYADHFEFLGVPRAARDAEVKEAYTRLVRILHPDACRDPAVADLGPERSAVFARLCQAYETLRSPAARAAYERDVAPVKRRPSLPQAVAPVVAPAAPQPTTPPAPRPDAPAPRPDAAAPQPELGRPSLPDAAQALDQAAALLRQEKFWDLIQLLEPRIPRLETRARHRAQVLLAQAYLKNPHWTKRAEAALQAVVAEDARHVDAHFLLAGLYLKTRLEARATAMFRKVLTLQPDHAGAAAGLKALLAARERPLPLPFLKRA